MIADQRTFMAAGDQITSWYDEDQFKLYLNLIREEVGELEDAVLADDKVKILDSIVDILVVTLGCGLSMGVDLQGAWNEVIRSNMSKVDPTTHKIIKRSDGKILKPATFSPANFEQFFE
jgi:predicted HAD superfamily Cof-like phosphohydrolase